MILFIDTTDNDFATIALIGKTVTKKTWQTKRLSETLLPVIENLLKRKKAKFQDVKKIVVVAGPGFFSRLRSGIVVANALSYALKIKVAGIKKHQVPADLVRLPQLKFKALILPDYGSKPNITRAKKP